MFSAFTAERNAPFQPEDHKHTARLSPKDPRVRMYALCYGASPDIFLSCVCGGEQGEEKKKAKV